MIYGYLAAAILVLAAIAGAGYKGYGLGQDNIQTRWDRANIEAAAAVEADRKAQDAKARKAASIYQAKIATQNITNRQISDALQRELSKKPFAADCIIPDGVRNAINDALSGQSKAAGGLPGTGKPAADAGKQPD